MSGNNVKAKLYIHPRYYNEFSCIGGTCPMSCCLIWRVDWAKSDVEKLKNAECSNYLRKLIDSSFKENGKNYMIQMDENKRCPFLTEDNLCSIQRELGAEYLSNICKVYPRNSRLNGNTILNFCNSSCYQVMNTLCNDSECMILENYRLSSKKTKAAVVDNDIDILNHPELKYRQHLFEFFYEIISDDSRSIETSIILGSYAAIRLTDIVNDKRYEFISDLIKSINSQINNQSIVERLESIKQNYEIKVAFAIKLNDITLLNIFDGLYENGTINVEKYKYGEKKFNEAFSDRPFALKNIALNLLMELSVPFRDKDRSIFDNYCYFIAAIAVIKIAGATAYTKSENCEQLFKQSAAYICRSFSHSFDKISMIIDVLKQFRCDLPANLSAIIK